MFVAMAVRAQSATIAHLSDTQEGRESEKGAAIVEWLGISALSVAMLVVIFEGMTALGVDLVASIRGQLGM